MKNIIHIKVDASINEINFSKKNLIKLKEISKKLNVNDSDIVKHFLSIIDNYNNDLTFKDFIKSLIDTNKISLKENDSENIINFIITEYKGEDKSKILRKFLLFSISNIDKEHFKNQKNNFIKESKKHCNIKHFQDVVLNIEGKLKDYHKEDNIQSDIEESLKNINQLDSEYLTCKKLKKEVFIKNI